MKLKQLFFVLAAAAPFARAATTPDWENEQVFQINREPARATFVPFASVEQARAGQAESSPWVRSLSSETAWKFNWVPRPDERPKDFWREDFDGAYEEGGDTCYVLTMHTQIIGRHHRMRMLERVITHILEHDGIWFAQMQEIADEFRSRSGE